MCKVRLSSGAQRGPGMMMQLIFWARKGVESEKRPSSKTKRG